jgi:radical SAM protein with 4Fe4S-binding SPASM domain
MGVAKQKRGTNHLGEEKFVLNEETFLVNGSKRGALYDLNAGNIFSIDEVSTGILSRCEAQIPLDAIIDRTHEVSRHEVLRYLKNLESENLGKFLPIDAKHKKTPLIDPRNKLDFAWLNLTDGCNLRCLHCYSDSSLPKSAQTLKELTTPEWNRAIDEIYRVGCRKVQYIGGEPFLYGSEIFRLIHHAREKGIEFQEVFTNATLLTEPDIEKLRHYGVHVAISFYSSRPEIHDEVTRTKGSFEKTLKNARRIKDKGVPFRIGLVAMKANQDYFEETLGFIEAEFDGRGRYDIVRACGRACDGEIFPDKLVHLRRLLKPEFSKITKGQFLKCLYGHGCWRGNLSVNPNGDITPCIMEREEVVGNIKEMPLDEILNGKRIQKYWGLSKDEVEVCRDCEFRYGCFDCRPNARGQTGSLYKRGEDCAYNPYTGKWDNSLLPSFL